MGVDNTDTINLRALLAENTAETEHVKKTLVEMELERDGLRAQLVAAHAKHEADAAELKRMRERVAEAEAAVRTTLEASDAAVFGLAESAERNIRNLTKQLAKRCPSCPCAIHRSQIVEGMQALDELDKAKD